MSALRTLVRGAALSALSVCISMVALLLTGKMFTNALDKETVGVFALLLVTADFTIFLSGLGLSASMPKLVAEAEPQRQRRIIGSALAWQSLILMALAAAVLLLQAVLRHPERFTTDPGWLGVHAGLHLLPLLFVIGGLRDLVMAMLAGLDRYGARAAGIAIASVSQVVLVYVVVWRLGGGLQALVLSMAASYGLALALLWAALGSAGIPRYEMEPYRKSVCFSGPLYINQVMSFFNQRFDTILVTALLGVTHAAVYEMIKRLPVIVNRVMNALLVPYLPHISRLISEGNHDETSRVLNKSVGVAAFVGYGAALGMMALREPIILILFNPEYLAGASVLGLLLVAASLALQSGIMGQTLIALGRNIVVPLVNVAAMIFAIAANLIIMPRFGIVGAGWVALTAAGFSCALQALFVHRAGIPVHAWNCLKPLLLLALCAIPLSIAADHPLLRFAAPTSFFLLCITFRVVTPSQLVVAIKALAPAAREEGVVDLENPPLP